MTDLADRILVDPDVLAGKPFVKGTRLAVEFLLGLMADGWTEGDLIEDYPGLVRDDILACLAYARAVLQSERVFPAAA